MSSLFKLLFQLGTVFRGTPVYVYFIIVNVRLEVNTLAEITVL